jgi:uncharacterized protein DUF6448
MAMKTHKLLLAAAVAALFGVPAPALAHRDTLDGPVVAAARKSLDTGKVEHALVWVQQADEKEIRHAFVQARVVRKSGGVAADLADRYSYETVVRVRLRPAPTSREEQCSCSDCQGPVRKSC